MFKRVRLVCCVGLLWASLLPAATARAEVFGDVLTGLDFAGFQFTGQRNPLSGGVGIQTVRNFQNTPLDFGFNELTLTGPVAATVTTASRGFRTLDFTLNVGAVGNPLIYSYVSDVGGTELRVDGSTVLAVDGSINQFGWYDMRFEWSSRQESSSTGRFANTDGELMDFDVGPIDVSGNIFADMLATITDPLFETTGYQNPFASFSGRTFRESALQSTVSNLKAKAAAGKNLSPREVSELVRMAAEADFHGDDVPSLDFLDQLAFESPDATTTSGQRAVPEPSTLLLLLIPASLCRRRRTR